MVMQLARNVEISGPYWLDRKRANGFESQLGHQAVLDVLRLRTLGFQEG